VSGNGSRRRRLGAIGDLLRWLRAGRRAGAVSPEPVPPRGAITHVVVLDGTMSSLERGYETNAGLTWRLLREVRGRAGLSLYYEPGIQWQGWRHVGDVVQGRGLNRQIRRAYGFLASRWRPGDRIYLFGYSRGAYAVRSLAGLIDRMGLIRREEATERAIVALYRHYQTNPDSPAARTLAAAICHQAPVEIEMVGVWDTVKALGLRLPVVWQFTEVDHVFHNHHLGPAVRRGFHALALDETREVFEPVLWETGQGWRGYVEQVWFRGGHGDVGGQVGRFLPARGLSNIPLVWMLERAEICGLPLPPGWRERFPCDPAAPMTGTWRGWGKIFLLRRPRRVGRDPSERIHPAVLPVPTAPERPDPIAMGAYGPPRPTVPAPRMRR
jgi:uncharacterized protein (DUF2235 family)